MPLRLQHPEVMHLGDGRVVQPEGELHLFDEALPQFEAHRVMQALDHDVPSEPMTEPALGQEHHLPIAALLQNPDELEAHAPRREGIVGHLLLRDLLGLSLIARSLLVDGGLQSAKRTASGMPQGLFTLQVYDLSVSSNLARRNALPRASKRAGLRPVSWHATIAMPMRYAHLSPDVKKGAVRAPEGDPGWSWRNSPVNSSG
jgi:hypothetical protein